MRIGITGHNGQLGRELVKLGGIPIRGRLMSEEIKINIEGLKPDAIINCAALTDVDYCETNCLEAAATNTAGADFLARLFNGYLVQISTDYIFDGLNGPYGVRDAPNPISVYGWSKLGGELATKRNRGPWLIIRTTVLFGDRSNNFVAKIVKQLREKSHATLYNPELIGTPTYIPALAAEIMRIVNERYTGIVHIAGKDHLTRLEFARAVAKTFGYDPGRVWGTDILVKGTAPRPVRAGLICDHSEYKPITSHNVIDGLKELAAKENVFNERPMERVVPR